MEKASCCPQRSISDKLLIENADTVSNRFAKLCKGRSMKEKQPSPKSSNQLIWGIALVLAGVGVLLRNLDVMPRLAQEYESFSKSVVVIFYLIGLVLIYGGVKKIIGYFKAPAPKTEDHDPTDSSNR
jgi:hypothetical protein